MPVTVTMIMIISLSECSVAFSAQVIECYWFAVTKRVAAQSVSVGFDW